MFKNYFKSALRFLKKNKIFAGINISGLSIALAASFIMMLYAINELSYDRCHSNSKNVFRVLNYYVNFNKTISGTPYILAPTLKEEFPQVEKAISVSELIDFKLKLKDEFIKVSDAVATDSEVFDIFTLPLIDGSSDLNLLDDPNSLVLSSELAEKIFTDKDRVGKEIVGIVNDEEHVFIVKGIFKNIPKNSTFRAQCLVNNKWPIESNNKNLGITNADKNWGLDFWTTWVLLSKDCNVASLEQQFLDLEIKYVRKVPDKHYVLQNLSDVYLGSNDVMYTQIKGNINNIRMFSVIALLIVLVAAINYVILSTAVSTGRAREIVGLEKPPWGWEKHSPEKNLGTIISTSAIFALLIAVFGLFGLTLFVSKARTKEIGIKKIFGSSEQSIIYSFLRGNFVLVLSASILSIPVTLYVMTKWLNNFSYKIHISWWVFAIAFIIAAIVVLSTVFIHSYKASRINPVKALKYE